MPNDANIARNALAVAIVERCNMLEVPRKTANTIAKNYFLGASKLAHIQGNEELAATLKESASQITEVGVKVVYKWAGVNDVIGAEKEAA